MTKWFSPQKSSKKKLYFVKMLNFGIIDFLNDSYKISTVFYFTYFGKAAIAL
jgi:hypothetical protein